MTRHVSDAIAKGDLMPLDRERASELTHVIPCTARAVAHGQFRALCGALVLSTQHAANGDATCEDCRAIDDEDGRQLLMLQQMPPAEHPVKSTWGNPLAGYRPKGSRR